MDNYKANSKPSVALIVLNINNVRDAAISLESLSAQTYPAREIILVDNGSTDGSLAALRARFPAATFLENKENLGFAAGNNVGLRYASERGHDYMMLLNNDIKAAPEMVEKLVAAAESDRSIGMIGPAVHDFDDRPDNFGWRFNRRWGYSVKVRANDAAGREILEVDTLSGCSLMVRREAYEKIGGLDERFFLLVEDVEWCLRCKDAGFRVVTALNAKIHHLNCSTMEKRSTSRLYYEYRNTLLLMRRHARAHHWLTFLPHFLFRKYLSDRSAVRGDETRNSEARNLCLRAMKAAFADFLAGRTGRGPDWLRYSV